MEIFLLLAIPLFSALASAAIARVAQRLIEYLAVAASASELFLALIIGIKAVREGAVHATPLFTTDALGAFILLFASIVGFAAVLHSVGHLRAEKEKGIIGFRRIREYYVLFHLFFLAMFCAAATASPLIMWVAIEATTLASAFLITFYNKSSALEAGWKHLIINSVGLLLGFLGTLLFLNAAAGAGLAGNFVSWDSLRSVAGSFDPLLVKIAFVFVLVGFGTKVGFVPMHTWLPDAHSKAPTPISSLLSGVLLNVALIAILRFKGVTEAAVEPSFAATMLVSFGILSLALSAFIIFVQKNYKRMLAYSSIEHMGILGIGFGFGGGASPASLYHMFYHALLKPILFFASGNFFLKYSSTKIANVKGARTLLPLSSAAFLAALLAISGIPPSGMFFTKLAILSEGLPLHSWIVFLALIALTIVFAGFVRHIVNMLYSKAPEELPSGEPAPLTLVAILFLAALFVLFSVWIPSPLATLVSHAAALL